MTDLSPDTLAQVRAASVQSMSREQRERYLRSKGWRRLNSGKQQKWEARNGVKATLAGACQIQVMADLGES
jgi:hypothetical protein